MCRKPTEMFSPIKNPEASPQSRKLLVNVLQHPTFRDVCDFRGSYKPSESWDISDIGGGLGLPLSDWDAKQLIDASHQSKGEPTLVDPSLRKAWEVSTTDLS